MAVCARASERSSRRQRVTAASGTRAEGIRLFQPDRLALLAGTDVQVGRFSAWISAKSPFYDGGREFEDEAYGRYTADAEYGCECVSEVEGV